MQPDTELLEEVRTKNISQVPSLKTESLEKSMLHFVAKHGECGKVGRLFQVVN